MKHFATFEAFEPKKIKERGLKNFVKHFLTKGKEDLADFQMELEARSKGFEPEEAKALLKQLDGYEPKDLLEVGCVAMMKHFLENYKKLDKTTIPTFSQMRSIVKKSVGNFEGKEVTVKELFEGNTMAFYVEDEADFVERFDYSSKECKFYTFYRDTNDRSALFSIDMVCTPTGAWLETASDRVSIGADEEMSYESISDYLKNW
jgi:hypothetical protein